MINYYKSAFGISLLFRVGGSAIYRSFLPGFASVLFTVIFRKIRDDYETVSGEEELSHPQAVGVLVSTLTFLLVFRVQQGYARYWEACSSTYAFLSKWMDAAVHTATFHLQSPHYDHIKPPSFFDHPSLDRRNLTRARERYDTERIESEILRLHHRAIGKSIEHVTTMPKKKLIQRQPRASSDDGTGSRRGGMERVNSAMHLHLVEEELDAVPLEGNERPDGNWGRLFDDQKATFFDPKNPTKRDGCGFAGIQGGRTPPLFLQELAHLTSLLAGVALSTLRNDIEGAESPLDIFSPGDPWPAVDPQKDSKHPNGQGFMFTPMQKLKFFVGNARSPEERTKYNASRSLPVLGGVSDGEVQFLQLARGPLAKTQLCWYWLSEFITREHLAGSMGEVGSPMISRLIQFISDGMTHYNHARKITFIPFPFPHAQLSALYVLVAIPSVALLVNQYARDLWLACVLAFFTVACLSAIHEVARELENPFRNIPNELPLVTLQAQFNEALLTMYSGYHPDHFWKEAATQYRDINLGRKKNSKSNGIPQSEQASNSSRRNSPKEETDVELPRLIEQMKLEMKVQKCAIEKQQAEIALLRSELRHRDSSPANSSSSC